MADRDPDTIKRDIDQARDQLAATVDTLAERANPQRLDQLPPAPLPRAGDDAFVEDHAGNLNARQAGERGKTIRGKAGGL